MANVLITGASGLLGQELIRSLKREGHEISVLGRSRKQIQEGIRQYVWDYSKNYIEEGALENAEIIVHLAGAPVADKRWTARRKKEIIDSRVRTADLLFNKLERNKGNVRAIISASAVGYYGDRGDEWLEEDHGSGKGFLAETCRKWEAAVQQFATIGIRECRMRIGIVLSNKGGALPQLDKPVRYGLGAYVGGSQYMPWIHIDDVCGIFQLAIENETMKGAYNTVAPVPVRAKELTIAIGEALNKEAFFVPVPGFLLRVAMGEMGEVVLLSNRVSAGKILSAGYNFKFESLKDALHDLYNRNR